MFTFNINNTNNTLYKLYKGVFFIRYLYHDLYGGHSSGRYG